jgi:Mor family transcriptional regulator
MGLAISLLSRKSLMYQLYAAAMDGTSVRDLAAEYRMPEHRVQEQIEAVRLALGHQVLLSINTESLAFRTPLRSRAV